MGVACYHGKKNHNSVRNVLSLMSEIDQSLHLSIASRGQGSNDIHDFHRPVTRFSIGNEYKLFYYLNNVDVTSDNVR